MRLEIEGDPSPGRRPTQRPVGGQIRAKRFLSFKQTLLCAGMTGGVEAVHPQRKTHRPHRLARG